MTIAETIFSQLYTLDSNLMMCMGATKFIAVEKGLQFKVNGHIFKGIVEITLDEARDLYIVTLVKLKKIKTENGFGVKKFSTVEIIENTIEGVFFDQLPSILESNVEKKAA